MDSESGQEKSDINSQPAKVTKSMNDLTNELGDILIDDLRLDGDFDCVSSHGMTREFLLVLDKKFMPKFNEGDLKHTKKSWIQFSATAAAYVYKSVGQCVSEPLRVWLSNAASAAILHGLLGELTTSGTADTDEGTRSSGEATTENLCFPDMFLDDCQDGFWYYGSWTVDNVATSSEMRNVLKAEMANACISVMIAAVVNYFQEGSYTPSVLMKDNYAWRILRSGIMEKYGLTDESDKKKAMLVTGHWVSELVVFHMATKHRQLQHPIRPVKIIGYEQSLKTLDISKYFFDVPVGFTNTRIAYMIANRMVRSVCIPFFEDFSELIELQQLYCQITSDPFHYHIDAEYLTNSPRTQITDTSKNLFGRLTTYLNIFEPRSELLLYPQLCVNGKTREKYYFDYNDHWKNILIVIYNEIYMPSGNHLEDALKDVCKISIKFSPENNMLKDCWEEYAVDEKIQQSILRYYQPRSPHTPQ